MVGRLMAKQAGERFATPAALVTALDSMTQAPELLVPPSEETLVFPRHRPALLTLPRRRLVLGILTGVLVAVALIWLSWPRPPERPGQPGEEELSEAEQALRSLRKRLVEPGTDRWLLRDEALKLQLEHPGTPQVVEAARPARAIALAAQQARSRWHSQARTLREQPSELVAVLGQHTGRHEYFGQSVAVSPDGRLVANNQLFDRGASLECTDNALA